MWLMKNQKSKIVDFEVIDDGKDFVIHLNQEHLVKEGKELIRQLLVVLQTYKSSGCIERGKKFYDEYSEVSDFFINVRNIVQAKKKPRRVELNNNLVRYNEKNINCVQYPEVLESIILSYADRFQFNHNLYNQMKNIWDEHKESLRV